MPFVESTGIPMRIPSSDELKDPDFQLPQWVNVKAKVGERIRNVKSIDTLWTQFIIKSIFDAPGMSKLVLELKIDGIYGDKTKAWIKHFESNKKAQQLAQGEGVHQAFIQVHPDGEVARVPPGDFSIRRQFDAYRLNKVLAIVDSLLWSRLTTAATSDVTLEAFIKASV